MLEVQRRQSKVVCWPPWRRQHLIVWAISHLSQRYGRMRPAPASKWQALASAQSHLKRVTRDDFVRFGRTRLRVVARTGQLLHAYDATNATRVFIHEETRALDGRHRISRSALVRNQLSCGSAQHGAAPQERGHAHHTRMSNGPAKIGFARQQRRPRRPSQTAPLGLRAGNAQGGTWAPGVPRGKRQLLVVIFARVHGRCMALGNVWGRRGTRQPRRRTHAAARIRSPRL